MVSPSPHTFAWTRWFIVLAGILGLALVFITPALEGTDEPAHLSRVAMIETGQIIPPKVWTQRPGGGADACITAYLYRHRDAVFLQRPIPWRDQFRNPECATPGWSITGTAHTADVYTPVPYAPALVGFRVGRAIGGAAGSLYGARLVQLAAFVALMALAIHRTPWGKPLLFTIGLLPVVIQGAANVSADPLTLALACCTVAFALAAIEHARTGTGVDPPFWWAYGALSVGLALSKSAYVPFVLLILAVPTVAFGTRRRRAAVSAAVIAVSGIAAGLWNIGVVSQLQIDGVNRSDSTVAAAWIKRHPLHFLEAVVRGWANPHERKALVGGAFTPVRRFATNFPLSVWVGVLWLTVVRLIDPLAEPVRRVAGVIGRSTQREPAEDETDQPRLMRRDRLTGAGVAITVAIASIGLIEYGLAIAANPPGAHTIIWVQGRYFLPLVPLTLFGVSGVRRVVPRKWLAVVPLVSVIAVVAWIWWASHEVWGWI